MESEDIHHQLDSYQQKCQELEEKLKKTEYDLEKEKEFHKRYQQETLETLLARLCRSESELHCLKKDSNLSSCNISRDVPNGHGLLDDLDEVQHKCQLLETRVNDLSTEMERKENQFRKEKTELDKTIYRQCLVIQMLKNRLGVTDQICLEDQKDENISKDELNERDLFNSHSSKSVTSSVHGDDHLTSIGTRFTMEFECDSDSLSSNPTDNADCDSNRLIWIKPPLDSQARDPTTIMLESGDLASTLRHPQDFSTAVGIHVRQNQPLACPICHRAFAQKSSLKAHISSHSEEKPFFCKLCEESFKHAASLNRHLKIHIGRKDFKCDICGKSFGQKGNLKTHIKFVHTKEKPFTCEVCGKGFTQKGDLQRHLRVHERYNQFPCHVCGKNFSRKDNLRCHLMRHEENEPSTVNFLSIDASKT